MLLSHAQIKALLPHRYPMLLVDNVVDLNPGVSIIARKNVTGTEPCFARVADKADAGAYAYPSTLIVESFCQVAGILNAYSCFLARPECLADQIMLFGAIAGCRFLGAGALPGETLQHCVRVDRDLGDSAICSGEIWVGDRRIAEIERVVAVYRPAGAINNIGKE